MKPRKSDVYEHALINIWFHGGKCWDGKRKCHDPQSVARQALKKASPEVRVRKNGTVSFKGQKR